MTQEAPIAERIRALEQRLEHRRTRLQEDAGEAREALHGTARRWLPVAAAAGAGLAALWLTRRGGRAESPRRAWSATGAHDDRRRVRWASLLGLATTAYKLGSSPQARILLDAFRRRRAAARERA
ncbi:MAG: hypothetical protein KJ018_08220 [Burkholderiales bacterium]|nr:hypothetical protein [Burkholderiales bacterium]GIK84703.1 MAG: hypothetical protein BroJett026_01840 [Betaproteobacteria bacterium]